MSYNYDDAARDAFYDDMYEQVSKEAVQNFTAERLCSRYDMEPSIAERPFQSLVAARELICTTHSTAAFIHAAISSEVMLKGVVLKPILYGFIHSDSIAPLIVQLAFGSTGLQRIQKLLFKVFQDVSNLDLMDFRRKGCGKVLWEELVAVQKRRDGVMHRAETATREDALHAVDVATAVFEELFPALAHSLGYHLHDGFRLCSDVKCSLPDNVAMLLEQTRNQAPSK